MIRESVRTAPRPTWRAALQELALVAMVMVAYFLTRGLVTGREDKAMANAWGILNFQGALGLTPEYALQRLTLSNDWLLRIANTLYLYAHLPVLIAVAVWLFVARPQVYPWFRTAFLLTALFGLLIYVLYPVAPPRFLPGFTDTLAQAGSGLDGSAAGPFYNPYAAMPSLHVGWSLLAAVALVACGRAGWLRAAGVALPVVMTFVVMMTGNHYLLDALAGAAVTLVSLALATLWAAWSTARAAPRARRAGTGIATGWALARTQEERDGL